MIWGPASGSAGAAGRHEVFASPSARHGHHTVASYLVEKLIPAERTQDAVAGADADVESGDAGTSQFRGAALIQSLAWLRQSVSFCTSFCTFCTFCTSYTSFAASSSESTIRPPFRLLDRRGLFGKSRGRWAVFNASVRRSALEAADTSAVANLFLEDMYHTFLDAKFYKQLFIFAAAYLASFMTFAVIYLCIASPCGLDLKGSIIRAYLLSVETMLTIGFGLPDPFMKGCWEGAIVLTVQCLLNLLLTACLIGVIFQGIARPQSRACTILFSEKAVIRYNDGAYYLMFRLCDLRVQHALIEAHVRCYCVYRHPHRGYEMIPMRLEHPDDSLGANLLLTLPCVVVHRIDAWSPLAACGERTRRAAPMLGNIMALQGALGERAYHHLSSAAWPWTGTWSRQADAESGLKCSCACPTCGATFATAALLQLHSRYTAAADVADGIPAECCHKDMLEEDLRHVAHKDPTREDIATALSSRFMEVVVLVEGIEPTTASTLQARHSYVVGRPNAEEAVDVAWDMCFAECCFMSEDGVAGGCLGMDLSRFHTLEPCTPSADIA